MNSFINTREWPIARLVMPDEVADHEAQGHIACLAALYEPREPFVLLMAGAELPRHSPAFMKAYVEWSMGTLDLAREYCLGAIRVEPDSHLRQGYQERAAKALEAGTQPYPYEIVADEDAASELARHWLAVTATAPSDSAAS
ncbi:hypothetical protein WBP07_28370 [Novosphingobium sp. BL-8A]|uniref:hypothetical protein n=1 Tax=Novosphingobium sp. BL-8A TaxID=3127639 RepID=UPI003757495E